MQRFNHGLGVVYRLGYGWPVALVVGAVGIMTLLQRDQIWSTEWRWAVDWIGVSTLIAGPLLAGVSAARARGLAAGAIGEAVDVSFRGRLGANLATTIAITLTSWVVYGTVVASALVLTLINTDGGAPPLLPLVPQFSAYLAYTAVGIWASGVLPSRFTPPALSLILFGASLYSFYTPFSNVFHVGGATGSLKGLTHQPAVLTVQVLLYISVAGWAVFAARRPQTPTRRRHRLIQAGFGLLVVFLLFATTALGDIRFESATNR